MARGVCTTLRTTSRTLTFRCARCVRCKQEPFSSADRHVLKSRPPPPGHDPAGLRMDVVVYCMQRYFCSVNDLCGGFVADGW